MAPSTAKRTLYRLTGITPTQEGMLAALDDERLLRLNADIHFPDDRHAPPFPSLLITTSTPRDKASWCEEVARSTGCVISEPVHRMGALHMFAVDDDVFAVSYDQGYRLLSDHLKDTRFGLQFAIRRVNPMQVRDLQAHTLGEARTDIAIVPGGTPALALGVHEHAQIVRRLGGYLENVELTRVRGNGKQDLVSVEGGCGLRLPLGIEPDDLVRDVREVARVIREDSPRRELEFVEHMTPVKDVATVTRIEQVFDEALGQPPDGRISMAVPFEIYEKYAASQACHITINSTEPGCRDDFELGYLLERARLQQAGQRLDALRKGVVDLYGDRRARRADLICSTMALHWIEANVSLDSRRFCLLEGEWYEIGAAYLEATRRTIARLFADVPSVNLPPWGSELKEREYNEHVRDVRRGYVCLDRKNVRNPLDHTNGVEICDLLAPDDTLVMVKHAHGGSGSLSHLFHQGLVAVQLLKTSADVRGEFAQKVFKESKGKRTLPEDFVPRHVVFAILLKRGKRLTPDSLFPFSQIALAHTVRALEAMNVTVEVVGIDEGDAAQNIHPVSRRAA